MSRRGRKRTSGSFKRSVLIAVLGLIIGLSIYRLNAAMLVGEDMPMPFGYGISTVLSGSMEPTISVGDLIVVKETGDFGVGDIVVYKSGGISIVHRVIRMDGDTVITKGDANNAPDEAFNRACVRGVVLMAVPYLGSVMWALKSPVGILVILAAALILLELSFRRDKQKHDRDQDQMREEIRALMDELGIDETGK